MQRREEERNEEPESSNPCFKVIPIHGHEIIMIAPVTLMMFCALFVYTMYRDIKDAFVFGEEKQTITTVQWCKVLVMIVAMPVATMYFKLSNMISRSAILYHTLITFTAYFLINAFLIHPNRAWTNQVAIHVLRTMEENWSEEWMTRLAPMLGLFLFPINSLHYVASELWGTISISFLVWGYVNEITPKAAAKRYYAVLGMGAQLGPMLAGKYVKFMTDHCKRNFSEEDAFAAAQRRINLATLAFAILFAGSFAFLDLYVMKMERFQVKEAKKKKKKASMGVTQAIKYCLSNTYVLALGGIVFAYGMVMVIGEMSYKEVMKLTMSGDQSAYSKMKGIESEWSSIVALLCMLFLGHHLIRILGWTWTALTTPMICGFFVIIFYLSSFWGPVYEPGENGADDTSGWMGWYTTHIGLIFCFCSKAIKYATLDPAKEMAYLPLSSEQKYKAKAAVDIVGARFGKGFGAVFNILVCGWLLKAKHTYLTRCMITAFIAVIFGLTIWVCSTLYLGRELERSEEEKKLQKLVDQPEPNYKVDGNNNLETIVHKTSADGEARETNDGVRETNV